MAGSSSGGGADSAAGFVAAEDDGRRFRRLADLTVLATFALIVLGGVVRVSESGLGCGPGGSGTEGWPLCNGEAVPLFHNTEVIIEFSHRLLAAVVTALIVALVWTAYRRLHQRPASTSATNTADGPTRPNRGWPLRASLWAGALVLVQAALGGATVEKSLDEELVAAHLGLAMLLLGLLLWIALRARVELAAAASASAAADESRQERARRAPVRRLKPFAAAAAVLLLGAIVAGGYVAGTEKRGVEGGRNVSGAHSACGDQFPGCVDRGVMPFGESRLTDIHLTHRALVYSATLAILILLALAYAGGARSRLLALAGGLLALQLVLGALNVWLGEHAALIVAHLVVATLLWSALLLIAYRLAWAPRSATETATRPAGDPGPSAVAA